MISLANGVWQFGFAWRNVFNAYYIEHGEEGIVVDASTRWDRGRMIRQLRDRRPTLLLLTHAHPDHQGCAARLCREFRLPMAVHEADAESAEGRAPLVRQSRICEFFGNLAWSGPRGKVSRVLREGDEVGGFRVYHMPGHSPGAIVLWRESDRVAIIGDVLNNNHNITHRECLREPPHVYSFDFRENRKSIKRLASMRPSLVLFGHGPPLRDPEKLARYAETL